MWLCPKGALLKRDGCEYVGQAGNELAIGLHRALTDAAEQPGCGRSPGVLSTRGAVIGGLAAEFVWPVCWGERPPREEKACGKERVSRPVKGALTVAWRVLRPESLTPCGDIAPTPVGPHVVLIMAIVAGEVTSVPYYLRGP